MAASASGQQPQDQRFSGSIDGRGNRVPFELQLQQGQVVTLTTAPAQNLDTVLTLNDPSGRRVAENDDQAPGVLSSRVIYVAPTSGRYTAYVTGYAGATGAFDLNITYGVDVGLSDEARVLREESVALDRRRSEARFPVDLAAGDIFVASTFAVSGNIDTTLALHGADGAIIAQNDDMAEGNLNSQIVYQIVRAGRYEVVASTYGGNGSGSFFISLAVDPNARAPFNFDAIEGAVIVQHEGQINDSQESREYRVTLAAGQNLFVSAETTSGNLDPVVRVNGPDGLPVALNDDRGDGSLNSAVAFAAPVAGEYTVELYRFRQGDSSGGYRLVMRTVNAATVEALAALVEGQVTLSGAEHVIETTDFRVHYTLEGIDASSHEYARATADTLQQMYDAQIRGIGWAAPVRDRDGRYSAYVADARGSMGYTKPAQVVFDNPNTPNVRETGSMRGVFVIDNDFRGMGKKVPPESSMRATATHEFNHVIQYGYDGEEGLRWLYESTASWVETVTVGEDQDATGYVATDYAAPELCWTTNTRGHDYSQWTLIQSLVDSHGQSIVVRLWENTVPHDGFDTMANTLSAVGSNIPDTIRRWRVQNFARDYELAPLFERAVQTAGTITRAGAFSPRDRIQQLGANYIPVRLQGAQTYTLRGDANLEIVALGRRNGRVEAISLGRGGVFDASAFENPTLMVFHRAVPVRPGACSNVSYSINVAAASGAMPEASFSFSDRHFLALANR